MNLFWCDHSRKAIEEADIQLLACKLLLKGDIILIFAHLSYERCLGPWQHLSNSRPPPPPSPTLTLPSPSAAVFPHLANSAWQRTSIDDMSWCWVRKFLTCWTPMFKYYTTGMGWIRGWCWKT